MKRIFTSVLLLLSFCADAQQIIFEDDFESYNSYVIYGGWTHQFTGPVPWQTGLPYLVGGLCHNWPGSDRIAGIPETCAAIDHNNSNVVLKTPALDLSAHTDAWLKYDSYFQNFSNSLDTEWATVEVTTNGGAHWDTVQIVPANTAWMLNTYFIDLTAYEGMDSVQVGFRYSDGGGLMKGWEIDNVQVFAPVHKDLKLVYVTPVDSLQSYLVLNNSYIHQGQVFNYGIDTITEFTATYMQDNGIAFSQSFTGLQIPPFTYHNFTHPVADTIFTAGRHKVTMWVGTPNDNIHHNDTAITYLNGALFNPEKMLVVEEGTGTWNVWGPRGWTMMNQVVDNDINICQIAVHGTDPMSITEYDDFLYYKDFNYTPYFLFDRRKNVEPDSFFYYIQEMQQNFGFANISMNGGLWGTGLSITTNVTPAVHMQGDYRLALVITEDSVRGSSTAYDQRNKYAGGAYGPMGGFENKPDPVPAADMFYNFTARMIFPHPDGVQNMLPATMNANSTYSYTFHTDIDPTWNVNRLKAYVLLIDNKDSTVLNSQRLSWLLTVDEHQSSLTGIGVYPNPSTAATKVYFDINTAENIGWTLCDISGRTVKQGPATNYGTGKHEIPLVTADMPAGVYLFTLQSAHFRKTLKLQVMH